MATAEVGVGTEVCDRRVSDGNEAAEGSGRGASTNGKGCSWVRLSLSHAIKWAQGLANRLLKVFTGAW